MSTIVITGANRGIGFELARQLRARGDDVIACCRSDQPGLAALDVQVFSGVDVTDDRSVRALRDRIPGSIDVLINNAGVLEPDSLEQLDFDAVGRQFQVNAVGALRVTHALRDRLARPGRVAIITSRMGSITDNTSGRMYGYRMSKAAVNAAGRSLAVELAEREVSVALLHPGFVRTDMTGGSGNLEASESAALLIARIDEMSMENSGTFRHADGSELPW